VAVIIVVGAAQVGCGTDSPTASTELAGLIAISGNHQMRWPGGTLPISLRVRAVDGSGKPIARGGLSVTWRVQSGDGAIEPANGVTDADGSAMAQWTLGPEEGVQTASAQAEVGESTTFTARAVKPGPLLCVSWDGDHVGNIFLVNEDGSNQMGLLSSQRGDSDPTWSPNGSHIAFVRVAEVQPGRWSPEVFVANADGSDPQQLTFDVSQDNRGIVIDNPAWSPDGSRIAFSIKKTGAADCTLSDYNIYVMEADGTGRVKLTEGCGGRNTEADWSPDGSKIVFTSRRDSPQDIPSNQREIEIYVMGVDGTEQTRLTTHPHNDTAPKWTPDGTRIFFARSQPWAASGWTAESSLWQMNPDGTAQELIAEFDGIVGHLEFSPDGDQLVLDLWKDDESHIFVFDLNTHALTQITTGRVLHDAGSWRP
jgi:Tol biopolymer transport system component